VRRPLLPVLIVLLLALPAAARADDRPARVAGPTADLAWTARVEHPVVATTAPGGGRRIATVETSASYWGGPNVLLVTAPPRLVDGAAFVRVRLKRMPAGSAGWIAADAVALSPTRRRIVVDLSQRRVTLTVRGKRLVSSRVVVGAASTPTPTGLFAVDAPVSQHPELRLGRRVLALTAYSRVLARYQGGIPQVALHAYEQLGAPLGAAASHGCVRMPERVVQALIRHAPRGTPVVIQR